MTNKSTSTTILSAVSLLAAAGFLMACAALLSEPSATAQSGAPITTPADAPEPLGHAGMPLKNTHAADSVAMSPVARGQAIFVKQCSICHGEQGDGAGKFAYLMNPRPRNFKTGKFKLTTTQNLIPSDDDLFRTISRGMPGSAMPPWGHLPVADLKALVAFVRAIHVDAAQAGLDAGVKDGSFKADEVASLLP